MVLMIVQSIARYLLLAAIAFGSIAKAGSRSSAREGEVDVLKSILFIKIREYFFQNTQPLLYNERHLYNPC